MHKDKDVVRRAINVVSSLLATCPIKKAYISWASESSGQFPFHQLHFVRHEQALLGLRKVVRIEYLISYPFMNTDIKCQGRQLAGQFVQGGRDQALESWIFFIRIQTLFSSLIPLIQSSNTVTQQIYSLFVLSFTSLF